MSMATFLRERLAALLRHKPMATPDLSLPAVLPALASVSGFPRFNPTAEPAVSVIIPARGQLPMTLRCLHSIALAETALGHEVIVVDDASDPALSEALEPVAGLRVEGDRVEGGGRLGEFEEALAVHFIYGGIEHGQRVLNARRGSCEADPDR